MSRTRQANAITSALKKLEGTSGHGSLNELRLIISLERAIARLARHPRLANHLVFKGGFVLLKTIDTSRFTRDVDALAIEISKSSIVAMVEHALKVDLYDGLWYGDFAVDDLVDQGPYGGYRFNCAFQIGDPPKEEKRVKKLSRIHIDVGFGDALKIAPAKTLMSSILASSKPVSWSVYPMEYIFAEKLEALCSRGSASSRAKDIYDMQLIFPKCEPKSLVQAITQTFEGRETPIPKSFYAAISPFDLTILSAAWQAVKLMIDPPAFDEIWKALLSCLKKIDGY